MIGIIPAYAGSTHPSRARSDRSWDHPRIRGEHARMSAEEFARAGSSPHTRGARRMSSSFRTTIGIIPAYAGSTRTYGGTRELPRDHPRIRGEHSPWPCVSTPRTGSSPHTRGARHHDRPVRAREGIIPAYAGSTWGGVGSVGLDWDHPRIRGEHLSWHGLQSACQGSSPHTRGALDVHPLADSLFGIIPAYAGSTPFYTEHMFASRDHPRIRGEHFIHDWLYAVQ